MARWNKRKLIGSIAITLFLIHLLAGLVWIASLPSERKPMIPAPIDPLEQAAIVEALKPRSSRRPVVAIIGINDATETTDYMMPNGILRRAGVADVLALSTQPGPVNLYPALRVAPDATLAQFDASHPEGADYVIVPAMSRDDDPAVLAWLRKQKAKGAVIVGVCAGVKVVANAGLLNHHRATTHWYYLNGLLKKHPSIQYVPNRRFVVDRGVVTTTGISASMPMMLTLIEAIGGRNKAMAVAEDLGVASWDARHSSRPFRLTQPFATTVLSNSMKFWSREELGIELKPGMDEVTLALRADAWSRTYRSKAQTFASSPEARRSRGGLLILPDVVRAHWAENSLLSTLEGIKPAQGLDRTLQEIERRYGRSTSTLVAMQLEYAW
jgi:putative intracellular protease/amidase